LLPEAWQKQLAEKPELETLVTDHKEWMDRAESLLQTYFTLEDPSGFESTYRELHLEKNFTDEIYLHGYVDRLDVAPTGEVRIVDYKTGKAPKSGWEEKALFQLRVYALLYWRNEGVLPKLLQLLYLGDGKTVKSSPNEKELEATERILKNIGDEILTSIETDFFPPKKSRLCDWCSFKNICPAHN
jgi:putative RecB family exonuclease